MVDFELECKFNRSYSIVTRRILRMLSENSRVTLTEMARRLKISRRNITKRLKIIEKEFNIKYTLDLSKRNIGLVNPHIILIKFGKKPDFR
jgi:DNA-binding Lrp family transcriptional regulator